MTILLASGSLPRRQLLEAARFQFRILPTHVDEGTPAGSTPKQAVSIVAERKAATARMADPAVDVIIAADTVASIDGNRLGKPADAEEANRMLWSLTGRQHEVVTALAVSCQGRTETEVVRTVVRLRRLERSEVAAYVATHEWADAAGGYRIQGQGGMLVEWIRGSYSNVVGLPMERLYGMLACNGYQVW